MFFVLILDFFHFKIRTLVKSVYQNFLCYFSTKTYVVGTQCLKVILSTQNICSN